MSILIATLQSKYNTYHKRMTVQISIRLPNLCVEGDKKTPDLFLRFRQQFINVTMLDTTLFKQYSFHRSNFILCVRAVAIFKQCLQFISGQ